MKMIKLVSSHFSSSSMTFVCSVCLAEEEIPREERVRAAECEHWVHRKCMASWLAVRRVCPACTTPACATVSFVDRRLVHLVAPPPPPTRRIPYNPMCTPVGFVLLLVVVMSMVYAFVLSMAHDDVLVIPVHSHFTAAAYMLTIGGVAFAANMLLSWPW